MINKLYNNLYNACDSACESTSKIVGIPIKIPRPNKNSLIATTITNGGIGIGFSIFGIVSQHKWSLIIGGLGIFGSILTGSQIKRK